MCVPKSLCLATKRGLSYCYFIVGMCIWFVWQSFGSMGAAVKSCQKLPLYPIKPTSASSKMDPPLQAQAQAQIQAQAQAHQ